jgi:hypothetical protein
MSWEPLAKGLIGLGALLALAGVALLAASRLGLHWPRLPGDFTFSGKGWSFHFPLATSLLLSLVLTVLLNLWLGRR